MWTGRIMLLTTSRIMLINTGRIMLLATERIIVIPQHFITTERLTSPQNYSIVELQH